MSGKLLIRYVGSQSAEMYVANPRRCALCVFLTCRTRGFLWSCVPRPSKTLQLSIIPYISIMREVLGAMATKYVFAKDLIWVRSSLLMTHSRNANPATKQISVPINHTISCLDWDCVRQSFSSVRIYNLQLTCVHESRYWSKNWIVSDNVTLWFEGLRSLPRALAQIRGYGA